MSELTFYKKILTTGKVKYTSSILRKNILLDPNSNNFLGIVSILKQYNVGCVSKKIETIELENLNLPLITHRKNPEEIVLLEKLENDILFYTNNDGYSYKIKKNDFEKDWTQNVIELDFLKALEKNYIKNFITENSIKIFFFFILTITITSLFVNIKFPYSLLYLANNLFGFFICIKLYKINITQNQEKSKICSVTKKTNCLSVINHKNSKLLGIISYDKIGLLYFSYALLTPVFLGFNEMFPLILVFAISSLFPFYSIYFQYFIVKSWCPLCLLIQIGLIINVVFIFYFKYEVSFNSIIIGLLIFFIITAFINLFSNISINITENKYLRRRLNLFINNEEVFENCSNKSALLISIPKTLSVLTGNKESANKITFVTNPFCKYCSEKYRILKEIIEYVEDVEVETIYFITNDLGIIKSITQKMLDIYISDGVEQYINAVDYWYSEGIYDYNKWLKTYSINNDINTDYVDEIINIHQEWCKYSLIDATPTILFNDKILPPEFELEDLKYII
ncbi:vitamin K epoxide reductase family protein [Flavobacterium sp.]|uniref:vitamin K epoxide reductase family protein n=1 Tax=Flavobacterium sp. TaxID=239 RepID=UPI00263200E2|nr:vitamin K epoxide reductase family protein [Flavobacterium sp.]